MKEPRFKVGDLVTCIDASHGCKPILNKKCRVYKVRKHYSSTQHGYELECTEADVVSSKDVTYWIVDEEQLAPYTEPQLEPLTDPNVDYEKLTDNPVYFEFVDIGRALNRLKEYEHQSKPVLDTVKPERYSIRYVIEKTPSGKRIIRTALIIGVNVYESELRFEDGVVIKVNNRGVYLTYADALEAFKKHS